MAQTETQTAAAAPETATSDATENNQADATTDTDAGTTNAAAAEDISYHAVEKDGHVTAIWEMQGRKHLRTIDPRSGEGKNILSLFTSDHHDE